MGFKKKKEEKPTNLILFVQSAEARPSLHVFLGIDANNAFRYQLCGSIIGEFNAGFGPWCVFNHDLSGVFYLPVGLLLPSAVRGLYKACM